MVEGRRYTPDYDATPATFAAIRMKSDVPRAVLVQPSFLGFDNSQLLQALAADPAHLRGVAVLSPKTTDDDLSELHAGGVRGIRFNLKGADPELPLRDDATDLARRVGRLGWHVEVYTESEYLPDILAHWADHDLTVVVDHMGCPANESRGSDPGFEALIDHAGSRAVFTKLSGPYRQRCDADRIARALIERVPSNRLLWGSDWPWTQNEGRFTYPDTVQWLRDWTSGAPDVIAELDKAAERLFDF